MGSIYDEDYDPTKDSFERCSPATANKATEEGELPEFERRDTMLENLPDLMNEWNEAPRGEAAANVYKRIDGLIEGYVEHRIEADRTSRQVANVPSEIAKVLGLYEPVSIVCAVQAIKALMPVHQAANKAEVEPVRVGEVELIDPVEGEAVIRLEDYIPQLGDVLYATSPATTGGANASPTGASTARDQALEEAAAPGAPTDHERADFEYWYVTHIDGAEIGSAICAARWSTWLARSGGFYKAPSDWLIAPMPWAAPAADIVAEFGAAPGDIQRDAKRFQWIEDNCTTRGGGNGFTIFVPVDHEDIGCGIDEAIERGN